MVNGMACCGPNFHFLEQDLNEAGLAAVPWADSALKPADTQAASDAPVDATTRTEKADVLSS